MRKIDPEIFRTAEVVRELMEDLTTALSPLNFDDETLQGACGISSRVLSRALARLGVQNDFVMGTWGKAWDDNDNHCWVEIPRLGLIIDVTATQFDIPDKVFITNIGNKDYSPRRKNGAATRRLSHWEGQSHVWYEDRLSRIEDQVVYVVQSERRQRNVA